MVLLRSKSAVFYQSQDWSKSNKLKMTNKRGTVKPFTFSFEIDGPNIISPWAKWLKMADRYHLGVRRPPYIKLKLIVCRFQKYMMEML